MSKQDQDGQRGLTKKARHRQKREQQKKQERSRSRRRGGLKTVWLLLMAGVIVAGGIGGAFALQRPGPSSPGSASSGSPIVSQQGLHWHVEVSISVFGEQQIIPANIGLIPREQAIHTHDEDNIIHLEFGGTVRQDDIRLGRFFEIWGRAFDATCIFDNCNGVEGTVSMLVNGGPSVEFENYIMQDGDRIEIAFE